MPRGKKQGVSLEERISILEADIKTKTEELETLKAKKAEENKNRLLQAVTESGKTIDEVIAMLTS